MKLQDYGFVRVAAASPKLRVADTEYNTEQILLQIERAKNLGISIIVFPELCLTGYTCSDLFHQQLLLEQSITKLSIIAEHTKDITAVVGAPMVVDNQLFNCAVVLSDQKILGIVPKVYVPNYNEFYEKRWFSPASQRTSSEIIINNESIPFGEYLLFKDTTSSLCFGIDVCEDLWVPIPPSSYHAQYGANLILNLSASNEIVGKQQYRRDLVKQQSARCMAAYVYSSANQNESTTDVVFSGHCMIAENGSLVQQSLFEEDSLLHYDIDIEKLMSERRKFNSFMSKVEPKAYRYISFSVNRKEVEKLNHHIAKYPFVPQDLQRRTERCQEIITIQALGLIQRLKSTDIKKAVIGISGGLDSTLALLVTVEAFKRLHLDMKNIIAVTMPGFGTTGRTYNNAVQLIQYLGAALQEIDIKEACTLHFKDIGHDIEVKDLTYENVQARERTQILMNIANKENALVIGTGDLSELALGWCTYNGDHMSMYAVNTTIPKTLVRYLVSWYGTQCSKEAAEIIQDICDTPVSPELLPPSETGEIVQKTEEVLGSYDIHDFFLYYMIRFGFSPKKIYLLAQIAFKNDFSAQDLLDKMKLFYRRFFTQQFKRSCLPDGVKVGSICLSPRGDWRMPSDASFKIWLKEIETL